MIRQPSRSPPLRLARREAPPEAKGSEEGAAAAASSSPAAVHLPSPSLSVATPAMLRSVPLSVQLTSSRLNVKSVFKRRAFLFPNHAPVAHTTSAPSSSIGSQEALASQSACQLPTSTFFRYHHPLRYVVLPFGDVGSCCGSSSSSSTSSLRITVKVCQMNHAEQGSPQRTRVLRIPIVPVKREEGTPGNVTDNAAHELGNTTATSKVLYMVDMEDDAFQTQAHLRHVKTGTVFVTQRSPFVSCSMCSSQVVPSPVPTKGKKHVPTRRGGQHLCGGVPRHKHPKHNELRREQEDEGCVWRRVCVVSLAPAASAATDHQMGNSVSLDDEFEFVSLVLREERGRDGLAPHTNKK